MTKEEVLAEIEKELDEQRDTNLTGSIDFLLNCRCGGIGGFEVHIKKKYEKSVASR